MVTKRKWEYQGKSLNGAGGSTAYLAHIGGFCAGVAGAVAINMITGKRPVPMPGVSGWKSQRVRRSKMSDLQRSTASEAFADAMRGGRMAEAAHAFARVAREGDNLRFSGLPPGRYGGSLRPAARMASQLQRTYLLPTPLELELEEGGEVLGESGIGRVVQTKGAQTHLAPFGGPVVEGAGGEEAIHQGGMQLVQRFVGSPRAHLYAPIGQVRNVPLQSVPPGSLQHEPAKAHSLHSTADESSDASPYVVRASRHVVRQRI